MELQYKILLYLDKRFLLTDMKEKCELFLLESADKAVNKFPPMRYLLEIDVMDLYDKVPELGDFLMKEPWRFKEICCEILRSCVQAIDTKSVYIINSAQIAVILRLKSIPQYLAHSNNRRYGNIMIFNGVLLNMSKITSYVFHTVWSCPEDCEDNEVILQYIPKTPLKCRVCRTIQFENSGYRRCGEQLKSTFKIKHEPLPKNFVIVDDLIPKLKCGLRYLIHAVIFKKSLAVWSIEVLLPIPAPITYPVSNDITELFEACNALPWQFIYCLASSFGIHVCPLHCFMHVKICLLLSLASVKANILTGSPIIHVFVSGYETRYISELMNETAKLADTSVFISNSNSSVITSMIASSGGVCVLPLSLDIYNHHQISTVLSILESKEITTERSRINLQCAVWAQVKDLKKITLYEMINIFGNICQGNMDEYSDAVAEFKLQQAIKKDKCSKKEMEVVKEIKMYLDFIAGFTISLDQSAENLLKSYFLAARRKMPKFTTIGSISALVALTLTSARLCRRVIGTVDDALFAIWLNISGSPEPRLAPDEYLHAPRHPKKLQNMICNFKSWLEEFIGNRL